jgi:hypothetical protein
MSKFRCSKCGCAENTALCHYWEQHYNKKPELCSECDPQIGKWHGFFPKVKFEDVGKK